MRLLALLTLFFTCACAHHEVSVARYDWAPEPSYGLEYATYMQMENDRFAASPVIGLGFNYTPNTDWGQERFVIKPKMDFRVEYDWSSGTWAELTGYWRAGAWVVDVGSPLRSVTMGPFIEVNHQFSNAARDTFGEHPRRPGTGFAVGWVLRW